MTSSSNNTSTVIREILVVSLSRGGGEDGSWEVVGGGGGSGSGGGGSLTPPTASAAGLGLSLAAVALLGLFINLYILVVVVLTRQVEGGGRVLLGHLSLVGVSLCCLVLVSSAPGLVTSEASTLLPCPLHGFLFTLLHPLALWTLCGLNCDRYWAIASPLHYATLVRPRKVVGGLAVAWALSVGLCLPPLFLVPSAYTYSAPLAACAPDFAAPGSAWYAALYTALTLLLPAAVIMACNLKVLMIARYHRHRIARAIFEVTLSAQVTITHQKNPFVVAGGGGFFHGRSASASVLQLVGSLFLLYVPYYSLVLWQSAGGTRLPSQTLVTLASSLLACSPSLNGLLYGLRSKILRRTVRHYWRKKMTKCELNQEIQARTPSRRPSLTPQRVWRPVSTSALGLSPRAPSLRHSATSTSILAQRNSAPRTDKPRILVTRASSEERHTPARIRVKLGGSSSSMSGESDITQEEEREWGVGRWGLGASSASLPTSGPAT